MGENKEIVPLDASQYKTMAAGGGLLYEKIAARRNYGAFSSWRVV